MEKLPNLENINWTSSADLTCVFVIDNPKLDQDDIETHSFQEQVWKMGILFLPSALLLLYMKLAMLREIDIDNFNPQLDFSTLPNVAVKITELFFKIMNKEGCTK